MKRLTKYLAIGAADYNYPADCYSGNDCNDRAAKSAYRQTCVERLAAYEDTGLTPERCAEFARADAEGRYIVMRDAEQEGVARLRELAEADKGGRLVAMFADRIPAADVAPVVHGRWIVRFGGPYNRRRCYCSHCGKHNGVGGIAKNQEKPYCPNCGAKMDGGDSDEADRR